MLFDNLRICGGSSGYHIFDTFTRSNGDVIGSSTEDLTRVWGGSIDAQVFDNAFVAGGAYGETWSQDFDLLTIVPITITFNVVQTSSPNEGWMQTQLICNEGALGAWATVGVNAVGETYIEAMLWDGVNQIDTLVNYGASAFSGIVQLELATTGLTITTGLGVVSAVAGDATPDPLPQFEIADNFAWLGDSLGSSFILDDLDIVGGYAPVNPTDQSSGGTVCQHFTGGVLQYTVSQPYTVASTRVYVDGTLQRLGLDYTETSHSAGTILFGTAPAPPSTVTVCYTASVG